MNIKQLPNILTFLRLLIVMPFSIALIKGNYPIAFWLFFLAGWTDLLDGLLARYLKSQTKLGSFLDPLADKLLAASSFIISGYLGILPLFLVVLVVAREIGIFIGLAVYRHLIGAIQLAPSLISKLNTALQVLLIGDVLMEKSVLKLPDFVFDFLVIALVITTIWSFLVYVHQGFADLKKHPKK